MKIKVIVLIIFSLIAANVATAQKSPRKMIITGTVKDASDKPVSNAIVMVDGKNTEVRTDNNGNYRIKVSTKAGKLGIFTFANGIIEESIGGRSLINFSFSKTGQNEQPVQQAAPGEEGVSTGYTHVKKKDLTTDINNVDAKNKYAKYNNIYDLIRSEVSGVQITGAGIIIQDSKDFFGPVPALLVVDGVYVDNLDGIMPSTVESINVLKGTSASIYGSRGYGGAIVIKTKLKH